VRHIAHRTGFRSAKRRLGVDISSDRPVWADRTSPRGPRAVARRVGLEIASIIPDSAAWSIEARKVALVAAREHHPAVILSSAPPHSMSILAWSLAGALRVPWVADLRDLWAGYPGRRKMVLRRSVDRLLEQVVFRRASALVTVSEPLGASLRRHHPRAEILVAPTGIDPALAPAAGTTLDESFTIVYAGRIYEGAQELGQVLRGLRLAADRGNVDLARVKVELLLLNPLAQRDADQIAALGLADVVRVVATVPREVAVDRERTAQVLLHLRWDDPAEPGILTGKLFEYLAARRPILSTGRYRDGVTEVLERTRAGRAATSDAEAAAYLAEAYGQFVASGRAGYAADPDELARLGSEHSAASLSDLLDRVAAPRSRSKPTGPQQR
jgi:glycosyltransferase involved in cell wall biosynthesis